MATIPLYNDGQMPRAPEAQGLSPVPRAEYRVDYAGLADAAARAHTQPLMPKEMFDGKEEAAKAWAGAVQEVGGLVADLATKVGQVRDAGAMADGEKLMRDTFAEYQGGLDPSSDVATRVGGWQKQSQVLAKQILGSGRLSSKAKAAMQERMGRFHREALIHLSADASKQAVSQARASFGALEQTALEQGDFDGARTANQGRTDAELQPPEVGAGREAQLTRAERRQELYAFIEENPRVAKDLFEQEGTLGYFNLTRRAREEGKQVARAAFARHEYAAVRKVKEAYDADDIQSEVDLDSYALDVGDETRGRLAAMVSGEWDMDDPVDYERAHVDVLRYNAKVDPRGEKLALLQTDLATRFNGEYEEGLQRELEMRAERTRRMGATAMDMEFASLQEELTRGLEAGWFGEWAVPASQVTWDEGRQGWLRPGTVGERGMPMRVSRVQQGRLANAREGLRERGQELPDELVDDMEAKGVAAQVAGGIRSTLMGGMSEGRYKMPSELRQDYAALMEPHLTKVLDRTLEGRVLSVDAPPLPFVV
jgi:hypothetical protein